MSQLICEKRGGLLLRWGQVRAFGRSVYLPYFSASPPLAKLSCFADAVTIAAGPVSLVIAMNDIEEVRIKNRSIWSLPLGGHTLTIRHHGRGPNPVIFASWKGLDELASALRGLGLRITVD